MNALKSTVKLPAFASLLAGHEEPRSAIQRLNSFKRRQRLLRHPFRTVLNQFAEPGRPEFQSDFINYRKWNKELKERLHQLPDGFITSYSLQPDSAHWLYELVRNNHFKCIIECGCGISTVIIALAIDRRPIHFISLEHDDKWLGITRKAMDNLMLSRVVHLRHSPLISVSFAGREFQAPDPNGIGNCMTDLLLIDAPPSHIGRTGVLPALSGKLAPGAWVVLDDAARLLEAESAKMWEEQHLAKLKGFIGLGTGIAALQKC